MVQQKGIEWNGMKSDIWGYGFLIPEGTRVWGNPYIQLFLIPEEFLKQTKQIAGMILTDSIPIPKLRKC